MVLNCLMLTIAFYIRVPGDLIIILIVHVSKDNQDCLQSPSPAEAGSKPPRQNKGLHTPLSPSIVYTFIPYYTMCLESQVQRLVKGNQL